MISLKFNHSSICFSQQSWRFTMYNISDNFFRYSLDINYSILNVKYPRKQFPKRMFISFYLFLAVEKRLYCVGVYLSWIILVNILLVNGFLIKTQIHLRSVVWNILKKIQTSLRCFDGSIYINHLLFLKFLMIRKQFH